MGEEDGNSVYILRCIVEQWAALVLQKMESHSFVIVGSMVDVLLAYILLLNSQLI
jgi:hypothetical protein